MSAEKTASSSSLSSVPLAWAGSLPPAALEVSSIEYFLATVFQESPASSAAWALSAVGLVLGQDDAQVTLLGLREAGLVLVVEVLDRLVGDGVLALDDLVADLVRQEVELDALEDVVLRLAGGLEELLVVGVLREALLLLLVEGLLDLGVGDLDASSCPPRPGST